MNNTAEIELNGVPVKWSLEQGTFTFFGLKSALFWLNPSLLSMLQPLADEIGQDLFRLLIAHSSSLGTDEDYQNMVTVLGENFEQGFANWGKAVSAAGWGVFEITAFDAAGKTARVRVSNAWELLLGNAPEKRWGCPFIQGKLIGIFCHAFQVNCWAEESEISYEPEHAFVEFTIHPSEKTISTEIDSLRQARMRQKEIQLSKEIKSKNFELNESKNRFRQLAEVSSDWVWEMDENLRFSYFSTEFYNFKQIGFDTSNALGKTRQDLIAKEELQKPHWKKHLADIENRREFRNFQYELITPNGKKHYFQINGVPVYDESGNFRGYRGTGADLTEKIQFVQSLESAKKEAEINLEKVSELNLQLQTEVAHRNQAMQRLNGISQFDYLTETLNRVQLKEEIQKLLINKDNDRKLAGLMFITLLGMEQINLQYGLEIGDAVLVETSLLIQDIVHEDDLVARSSGAEFIVFLPDCGSLESMQAMATQMIDAITQPFESVPDETINGCIGISAFSEHNESAEVLLSHTYKVMIEAKMANETIRVSQL
jgi:diguanylate cyclase (GGDEF)-like protein/PAS domain S-box-containing protein